MFAVLVVRPTCRIGEIYLLSVFEPIACQSERIYTGYQLSNESLTGIKHISNAKGANGRDLQAGKSTRAVEKSVDCFQPLATVLSFEWQS
jgi:hypothetical protein